jgi:4-hydroxyproline epimerase
VFEFEKKITVVDSHTGGEPTRVVVAGGPDLGGGDLAQRRAVFQSRFDDFRSLIVHEPRGSDVLVGALLCPPTAPKCSAGVIFFNNVGYLGMCVHAAIGIVTTLAYLERISFGEHRIETPVGVVSTVLYDDGSVSVRNVPSYRFRKRVTVEVDRYGICSLRGAVR